MLVYCLLLWFTGLIFFAMSVAKALAGDHMDHEPEWFNLFRLLYYFLLVSIYYGLKWMLKRLARKIDTAIIVANFSFEVITEIFSSSVYWCNFRMFCLRYKIYSVDDNHDMWSMIASYLIFGFIATIHIGATLFHEYFRMSAGYFNLDWRSMGNEKKSNITQWKVRGAIDTSIRFIIVIYSFVYISILFLLMFLPPEIKPNLKFQDYQSEAFILNAIIFVIEIIIFGFVIFKPGFAGKISDQQQINMAEPLMRMYNANRDLIYCLFCSLLVMASSLIF